MKSLPKIFKYGYGLSQGEAVLIPAGPAPPPEPEEEEALPEENPGTSEADFLRGEVARQRAECERLVREAQLQSEAIRKDAVLDAARLKQQAQAEGYAAALQEEREEIKGCIAQVGTLMDQLQQSLDEFLEHYRQDVGRLALEIAEKVLDHRLQEDDLVLEDLVRRAVSTIKKADWIKVEVSNQLPGLIERLRENLDRADGRIDVEGKAAPRGHCVVQTPDGIVDASVSTQLGNLRDAFGDLR